MGNLVVKMEVFQYGEKNKSEAILIAAFAGTGKTYCGEKYKNVLDFDHLHYKFVYSEEMLKNKTFEELKGQKEGRSLNPLWPENYFLELLENMKKFDMVLIPAGREIMSYLDERKVEYILCYPTLNSKSIYMKRYHERGTNPDWIAKMEREFDEVIQEFNRRKGKKIVLQKEETLESKLIEMEYLKKLNN